MHHLRHIALCCATALSLPFIISCGSNGSRPVADTLNAASPKACAKSDYTAEALAWADSVTALMDTAALIGQLVMPASYATADPATIRQVIDYATQYKAGGIVWLRGDTASMHLLADTLLNTPHIPLFMAIDAEWGLSMRLTGAQGYPRNPHLANTPDDTLYDYGRQIGTDARRLGLNMVLGPVLDVATSPQSAMSARSYGASPRSVADKGCALARGLADAGVIPVAKHFPGLGGTQADSHHTLPQVHGARSVIDSTALAPFRQYVNLSIGAVMIGHVHIPALDSIHRPATLSPAVITTLLRGEMHHSGLVLTDAMNMDALDSDGNSDDTSVRALLAGADLLLVPPDTHATISRLKAAVADGTLPLATLREKVRRILFYKYPLTH